MSQTQQIPAIPQVRKINLNQAGLEMFMGRTEAPIMRAVWQGKTRITTIHRYVCREYTELSKSSISTTVQRLVDKGFLVKLPIADSVHNEHEYVPTCTSEEQLVTIVLQVLIYKLSVNFGDQLHLALALAEAAQESSKL